jgi:hypothetical protein
VTACCLLVLWPVVPAAAQFEGEVEFWNKTTTDESGSAFEYLTKMSIKGGLLRLHTTSSGSTPASTMIYRTDRGVFWILNEEEQSYLEVRTTGGHGGELPNNLPAEAEIQFRATGKTRTILGYRTEQYVAEDGERKIEIWGTTNLQSLASALKQVFESAQGEEASTWNDQLAARGIFPMVSRILLQGQVVESSEVRKIVRKSVPDELFELPAGYRKVSVDALFEESSPPR